jgi:hypothetical protein
MNKIWTSRRAAPDDSVTSFSDALSLSNFRTPAAKVPLSSPLPDSGTSALRNCPTLSLRNCRIHEPCNSPTL